MKELSMAYSDDSENISVNAESFIDVNNPAYLVKSWPITRIFFGKPDELDFSAAPEIKFKKPDNICIKWCHSSHLKIFIFRDQEKKWAPTWSTDLEVLFFPFHDTFNNAQMTALGRAILDIVPEFVDKEVWQTPDEQTVEMEKFKAHLAALGVASSDSIEDLKARIKAKVNEEIRKEEARLSEHLRAKSIDEIAVSTVHADGLMHVTKFYELYRDYLIRMGDLVEDYNIEGLELQAQTIFDPLTNKSVAKERILGGMGIQWEAVQKEATNKKITRNKISARQIPLDFFWAIQPSSRSEGPKPIFLINPTPDNKHAGLIAPFGENARIASVMSAILGYGCDWDTELRSKSMMDSKSVHVMRGIIQKAIDALPADDPLAEYLRSTRRPDTATMPLKDIAVSMYNWSCAMLVGYTKYQDALNATIIDLQGRQPDGQKKRWDAKILGDLSATLISDKLPDIEMGITFADRMLFGPSRIRGGKKCLRVWLKPTTIAYDDRIYSMGRYVVEINVLDDKSIMLDFMAPKHYESLQDMLMSPLPRQPGHTNPAGNAMMHSHIQGAGANTDDNNVERIICLGEAKSRYYNAVGRNQGGGNVEKIPLGADHVFDGAPDFIQVKTINPRDLINTIWVLLRSCYTHRDGHAGLNMDNWHVRRVR